MADFLQNLYHWYQHQKRDLPWRKTSDPYKIWISEIILQQTRVNQGSGYYLRFIKLFPTVKTLATSSEDEVLKAWQGLGYYSRARNLHKTAKAIVNKFKGKFPDNYNDILELKGIGPYTAAAIASIAFNKSHATVDGNITRVLSRLFGIDIPTDITKGKKEIQSIADNIINDKNPGMHNQALMELGAVICTPSSPRCIGCPVSANCFAFKNKQQDNLPIRKKKVKQRARYFYYLLIEDGDFIYFQKRKENDIWENLYELPLIETQHSTNTTYILKEENWSDKTDKMQLIEISKKITHILTHQKITAIFIHLKIIKPFDLAEPLFRVNKKDISNFAVPRLIENYLIKKRLIN